ncbi:GNAT family acetyltransferase [Brevibacillus agri BAB-2500]|nr:GNAT family acetyltransferase [Brevibacillus agri BAB-2500]
MNMRIASAKDAPILTSLMHAAFQAAVPPSSALSETVEDVATQLAEGRTSGHLLEGRSSGRDGAVFSGKLTRFTFFRLSVDPSRQGRGIGRSIIRWLEAWAAQNGKAALTCRVRMEMEANMRLYRSEGFVVTQEEIVQREGTTGIPTAHMRKTIGN